MKKIIIRFVPVLFCVSLLVFSIFSGVQGLTLGRNYERHEDETVLVEIEDVKDRSYLISEDINIIQTYPNQVLVEIDSRDKDQLVDAGFEVKELQGRTRLTVKSHTFDREREKPDFSEELTIEEYGSGTEGLYILQMLGPVHPEWRRKIEEAGVEIINYIPNYAYVVRMTPERKHSVEKMGFVDWIGIYQPGFKIAEDLEPGSVNIRVVEDPDEENIETLASDLNIKSMTELSSYGLQMRARIEDEYTLKSIARNQDVYSIFEVAETQLSGEMSTQIIGGGCWIWDPEDDPDTPYRMDGADAEPPYGGEAGSLANQLGYTGEDIEIAVADTGIDKDHPDFQDRVVGGHSFIDHEPDPFNDGHGHGTHVSGSAAGDTFHGTGDDYGDTGYYGGQGTAPESELFSVKLYDSGGDSGDVDDWYDVVQVAAQGSDPYIHTNSWGGTPNTYTEIAEAFDKAVRDADEDKGGNDPMVITVAVGNEGFGDDYTIEPPASGKNVIGVGGSQNYYDQDMRGGVQSSPEDTDLNDPDSMYSSSGRGWTLDDRIKPDVLAPATDVFSTMADSDGYETRTGTSMATPAVAGAASTVVEWYEEEHGEKPSPAMVKSLFINTAYDLDRGEHTPNRREGWGMVNLPDIVHTESNFMVEDQVNLLQTGEKQTYHVNPEDHSNPMNITLTWTDKEALGSEEDQLLKNDLNLEVVSPSGDTYRGNAFSEDGGTGTDTGYTFPNTEVMDPFDVDGDGHDDRNNVLNVRINPNELEEGSYEIRVIGENVPADSNNDGDANQDYALVKSNAVQEGEPPSVKLTNPDGGEVWEAEDKEEITWSTTEGDDPIDHVSLWYSADGGSDWNIIESQIADTGSYTWTVPDDESEEALVKLRATDVNGRWAEDQSDDHFTILGPPAPLEPTDPKPEDGAIEVSLDTESSVLVEHTRDESMDIYFYDHSDDSLIGEDLGVQSGDRASVTRDDLEYDTTYKWYAEAHDGEEVAVSDSWSFTTEQAGAPSIEITSPKEGDRWQIGTEEEIEWTTSEGDGDITVIDLEYSSDDGMNWREIATGIEDDGVYSVELDEPTEEARIRATVHDENDMSSKDISGEFTIEEDVDTFDLTINVQGKGSTDPEEGTHKYKESEEVTVTAIAEEGWYFVEWIGDETGTDLDIDITIDEDKSITAIFEEEPSEEYELKINVQGKGSTDPEEGTHTYPEGEEVTVTAIPDESWYFVEWTGDHESTEEEITITMNNEKKITAHFEEEHVETYELTINIEGEGDTDPEEGTQTYERDEIVVVTAEADEDWWFEGWTGDYEGTEEEITITMDEDKEITAHFDTGLETYDLTINLKGDGTTDPELGEHIYEEGEEVTVTAKAEEGWYFVEWTGDHESTEEEITIKMDSDKEITAHFDTDLATYDLTINIEGDGTTDPEKGTHEHAEGMEVRVTAIPNEGWYFEEWVGDHESTEEEITITMDSDKEITAHFEEEKANFKVEIIDYEENVTEGEDVTIQFRVTNTGEDEGSRFITLYSDREQLRVYGEVKLGPDEEYEGEFTLELEEVGDHELAVDSNDSKESVNINVMRDDDAPDEEDDGSFVSEYWWLIIVLLIGVITTVVLVSVLVVKGKEEGEEKQMERIGE